MRTRRRLLASVRLSGSAIFNILIIIGITTISVGDTLILDWKPLVRDCTFYGAAVVGIATTFSGGRVDWWEGGIYVGLYGLYILFMTYNEFFMRKMDLLWPEASKDAHGVEQKSTSRNRSEPSGNRRSTERRRRRATERRGSNAEHIGDSRGESGGKRLEKKDENVIATKFAKRLEKIQTIASVLVSARAIFRRVRFVRCDQTRFWLNMF